MIRRTAETMYAEIWNKSGYNSRVNALAFCEHVQLDKYIDSDDNMLPYKQRFKF